METQTRPRSRPDLSPVYVDHREHQEYCKGPTFTTRTGALFSIATLRSDPPPSAMLPASGNDIAMRLHERAMIDSLDHRGRHLEPQCSPGTARSLSPIVEHGLNSRRASMASLPLPRVPAPSPQSPSFHHYPRRPTLASETRSILLSGIGDQGSRHPDGLPRITSSSFDDRRQSLPSSFVTPAPRRNSHQLRQELQAWGHVFLGNGSEAQCFVSAVPLRRSSGNSSADDEDTVMKDETTPVTPEPPNQLTVRVRVRPCALDRKPFLLTRTFDMDMLRATVPEPSPVLEGPRRISADARGRNLFPTGHRQSSVISTGEASPGPENILQIRSGNTVPIHKPYACAFFPVLAALLYSKHIQPRDIVDLPLPHPEVWGRTVAHVYTGQGELTEAISQNILYLCGRV
ncbi:hypothetical protein QC762_101840 [Podospora pseudocomata]|uniref:BTB domain-containing protein n=1 Tax=Podospora pseudocomata TaxID=2093779 RepID=A0ABR0GS39_9PEZI|nr:hypothetical protein QC762_101840 [Podospora pseudocomata]